MRTFRLFPGQGFRLLLSNVSLLVKVLSLLTYTLLFFSRTSFAHDLDEIAALVPSSEVTSRAFRSGLWSDPQSWESGKVPAAGSKVEIGSGITIQYDISPTDSRSTQRLEWVAVKSGGALEFTANRSVQMTVDTIVLLPGGALMMGRYDSPVLPSTTIKINFDSGGVGIVSRSAKDPKQYGIGLVAVEAKLLIYGPEKTSFLKIPGGIAASSKTLTLEKQPTGWQVGDELVITATYNQLSLNRQERRRIVSISGTTVTLDNVLTDDHRSGVNDTPVYAANLTRNITFRSRLGVATPPAERAHTMAMHAGDYEVVGVNFEGLGRTRKDILVDDNVAELKDGEYLLSYKLDSSGQPLVGAKQNLRGRYPFHFHFIQIDPNTSDPGILRNSVVDGSPGWGVATHESYAFIDDNVGVDVFGAHFVAEDGNEVGRMSGNLAIQGVGWGSNGYADKQMILVNDFGHRGNGFWLEGRGLEFLNNTAVGCNITFFHRGYQGGPIPLRDVPGLSVNAGHGAPSLIVDQIPLINVKNMTVVGGALTEDFFTGVDIVKANPDQTHLWRNFLDGVSTYNVDTGISAQYTAHYTVRNLKAVSRPGSIVGVWNAALFLWVQAYDFVASGVDTKGFANDFFVAPGTSDEDLDDLTVVDVNSRDVDGHQKNFEILKTRPDILWNPLPPLMRMYPASSLLPNRFEADDPQGYEYPLPTTYQLPNGGGTATDWWNFVNIRPVNLNDSIPQTWVVPERQSLAKLRFSVEPNGFFRDAQNRKWVPIVSDIADRMNPRRVVTKMWKVILPENFVETQKDLGTPDAPVVTTQPISKSVDAGSTAVLSCDISFESLPVDYSWYKGTQKIDHSQHPNLRIPHASVSDSGEYHCEGTNFFGVARSSSATLTVVPKVPSRPSGLRVGG